MQVRVITLERTSPLVKQMEALFPHADVGIQRGIDVRKTPTQLLFSSDLITHSVVHSLQHGRRYHHEVATKGAVGLAQANRLALEEDPSQPLLLLEADCRVVDAKKLKCEVSQLLFHADKFDVAVFGAQGKKEREGEVWMPPGFYPMKDMFWLLQCVLYTPSGRSKVGALLHKPLEMQIDSLYGAEAKMGNLTVVGQLSEKTTMQTRHVSSVQSGLGWTHYEYHRMACSLVVVFSLALCLLRSNHRASRTRSTP